MKVESLEEVQRIENLPYRLNKNITQILDGFKWAVHDKNTSVVIIFDGRSGMGKTTLNNQVAKYCDPDYDLHKVHYSPETFLNGGEGKIGLAQAKKGDWIVFDEAMLISNRSALSQINRMIIQAMSMIRSKNIFVCFCVNSIFDLDKNLALSRADILFNVYGETLIDRGKVMAFFKGADSRDRLKELYLKGKKYYDYSQPKSNFNTTFASNFVLNEDIYEKQKQKGVNDFLNNLFKKAPKERVAAKARDFYIIWIKKNTTFTHKEIAEIGHISVETVKDTIERFKEHTSYL